VSWLSNLQTLGIQALQGRGHVSQQHSPTGQVIAGRAGNPSVAAFPHHHPGKSAVPMFATAGGTVKSGSPLTSLGAVLQSTSQTFTQGPSATDYAPIAPDPSSAAGGVR
jgi:hypothetical protein